MLTRGLCAMQGQSDSDSDWACDDGKEEEWDGWMNEDDVDAAGSEQQSKPASKRQSKQQQQQQHQQSSKKRKVHNSQPAAEFEVPGQGPANRQGGRTVTLPARLRD
jgi:TATA-binding protein-associated factor Taf7